MSHIAGKFVAVILAIWLPLFGGNALAVSVAMQAMVGGHHSTVVQPGESMPHCVSTAQQHTHHAQLDANLDQSAGYPNQQNSASDNCGTCHFACCGYLAATAVEVTETKPPARQFTSLSAQFQSIIPIPLDPPPLARA